MRALRVFVCALTALAASVAARAQDNVPAPVTPTYAKEVSRIMQAKCADCHHPNGIGPFSLLTYRQTKGWAEMIKEVVSDRRMPPWHADPAVGKYRNDRRLTEEEIQTIVKWADGGKPMGNEADLPAPIKYSEDWRISGPDMVFELPQEQSIEPSGVVPYREIEIPTNFTEDKWLQAIEARASNPKVVHHIIVFVRSPEMQSGERQDCAGLLRRHTHLGATRFTQIHTGDVGARLDLHGALRQLAHAEAGVRLFRRVVARRYQLLEFRIEGQQGAGQADDDEEPRQRQPGPAMRQA